MRSPKGDKIHNVEAGIIGVAIGSLYQKLNKMGFSSGKEFATAISEAKVMESSTMERCSQPCLKALNANLVLGDRPVNETLIRLQQSIDKTGWSQVQAFARSYPPVMPETAWSERSSSSQSLLPEASALSKTMESEFVTLLVVSDGFQLNLSIRRRVTRVTMLPLQILLR